MGMASKRTQLILIAIGGLITIAAFGTFILFSNKNPHYENIAEIKKSISQPVILPTKLPSGSHIQAQPTFQPQTKLVTTIISIKNDSITITQQKSPPIDLKQLDALETYLVQAGSVYILKGEENRFQAIVASGNTWVMVNAPDSVGLQAFKDVIASLDKF